MDITFLIPGMPFLGDTLDSQKSLGGSETMGALLSKELAARGHRLTVFTAADRAGDYDQVHYAPVGQVTQAAPFGTIFHHWAENIPQDILVIQRIPAAFHRQYAAKANFWWTHDLALRRMQPQINAQLWNVDRVLAVSEFHKKQIGEVYGVRAQSIGVLPNGLDLSLLAPWAPETGEKKKASKTILYSSRPERGLSTLLDIADILAAKGSDITFLVCGYDNTTPEMAPYYHSLWSRASRMSNVKLLGPLGKAALAQVMREAWLHVYPTSFEETSCLTVMEEQAAGTPVITAEVGALPETLEGGGAWWVGKGEAPVPADYARAILTLRAHPEKWDLLREKALSKAPTYAIARTADAFEKIAEEVFKARGVPRGTAAARMLRQSDVVRARALLTEPLADSVERTVRAEIDQCYGFAFGGDAEKHYQAYYEREAQLKPGSYEYESTPQSERFRAMVAEIRQMGLPPGSLILDYGCGHGHVIAGLVKEFPTFRFLGVDWAEFNIRMGNEWRDAQPPAVQCRVEFRRGKQEDIPSLPEADLVIAAEVLEHVVDALGLIDSLATRLKEKGWVLITTPYGPWEALGFEKEWPWRAHLHHFDSVDLRAMFGHHPYFRIGISPNSGRTEAGESIGSYLTVYQKPTKPSGQPTAEKLGGPAQTLSVCMIVKGQSESLPRVLKSVRGVATEIIIGVDGEGRTWDIAKEFRARTIPIPSPLKVGFAAARNLTIAEASGDWILWIDDDEELLNPEHLRKFLRPNCFDAYAVHQAHISGEPVGLIRMDLPCRLFRNRIGFKFYGLVHEHPEKGSLNSGAGTAFLLPQAETTILHTGYSSEAVRRERFQRNFPLMVRDRQEHPERILGKFLWLRDLWHMSQFELERGSPRTEVMIQRAQMGIKLWEELVKEKNLMLAIDGLQYLTGCTELLYGPGGGLAFGVCIEASIMGIGDSMEAGPSSMVRARFPTRAHAESLVDLMMHAKLDGTEGKYL